MIKFNKMMISSFLLVMMIFASFPAFVSAANSFKDVKTNHGAYSAIEWAYKEGITSGYPDGTFLPDRSITEAQFATMLSRFDRSSKGSLQVSPGEHKASGIYRYLNQKHMPMNGYTNTKLRDQSISKGQAARIIAAFQGIDVSETYAVYYLYTNDLANGVTGKNDYKDFGANLSLTRADAAVLLHRLSMQGANEMIGLNKKANGNDDNKYKLPASFLGNGTVWFPDPEGEVKPPVSTLPPKGQSVETDIEKQTLIANGKDSTFITLTLKSCSAQPIAYEDSYSFKTTSTLGAIDSFAESHIWSTPTSANIDTDGPELTVKITAPKLTEARTDTIKFQLNGTNNPNMDCYKEPITVHLNYKPQAELQLETTKSITLNAAGLDQTMTTIRATIVRPGGEINTSFNGSVRFHSPQGVELSATNLYFTSGIARITATTPWTTDPVSFEVFAEIDQVDSRYKDELASVLTQKHRADVHYEQPLVVDTSCSVEKPEVAFIIDSSGSMKRNDQGRYRVIKSQELILALNAPLNIGADFNNRGRLLSSLDLPVPVSNTFIQVRQSGGTNIADGLKVAFDKLISPNPKVAILVTDGKSNKIKTLDMIKEANLKKIKVYTIGLGSGTNFDEDLLQQLADGTGGTYFHIEDSVDIGNAYESILAEITCGTPPPSCKAMDQVFTSPSLEYTRDDFFMSTFINERCGEISKVVLRFNSYDGDIDYTLIPRGQKFHALTKKINEIENFDLYVEGIFLAYDTTGKLVGKKSVKMTDRPR